MLHHDANGHQIIRVADHRTCIEARDGQTGFIRYTAAIWQLGQPFNERLRNVRPGGAVDYPYQIHFFALTDHRIGNCEPFEVRDGANTNTYIHHIGVHTIVIVRHGQRNVVLTRRSERMAHDLASSIRGAVTEIPFVSHHVEPRCSCR